MTVAEAIRAASGRLEATSDTARLDAELLMAHALDVSRSQLLIARMQDDAPLTFSGLVDRRATHEPIAYILGYAEFYGQRFHVEPGVLIPRPDSETLIDAALGLTGEVGRVADFGAGSGALLLAFLANRPDWKGLWADASFIATRCASKNAHRQGLEARAEFHRRIWTKPDWSLDFGTFDLILCNPPYVEESAELDPDVRNFEPPSALFGGDDGLDDYRVLIPQMRKLMNHNAVAIFEIGASQAEPVTKIAQNEGFSVQIRNDLANRPRCVVLR
ncbi:MAG: peptide chain release factor N(5)-glutamine methyltransferase [Pseudomonadota bacterium]